LTCPVTADENDGNGVGPRIVIVGAAGFTNLGDDAILTAILAELREALHGASFVVAGGDADAIAVAYGVEAVAVRDIRAVDAALAGADLAIVGGGGFIFDYDGIISPYDFLRGDITYMFPYYRAAICARARDVPVYFYAIGVDSLVTPAGRALTRDVLSLASAITLRDPISLLELQQAGVRCPVIEVTADPAVRIAPPTAVWEARPRGKVVAFVVRPWLRFAGAWTPTAEQYFERYVGWLASAADHVVEVWDATPVFLPGQRYSDDDLDVAERIVSRMTHAPRAMLFPEVVDEERYRAAFAAADAVVSTRLHPLILAATADVPVVGIPLSEKVRAFLSTLGLVEQIVSPWSASFPRLRRALDSALGDPEPICAHIRSGLARQRQAAARNPTIAADLLAGPAGPRTR
jgi:polysaccharide pyruvyl transferase CsaB